jgi:hypothetical protein
MVFTACTYFCVSLLFLYVSPLIRRCLCLLLLTLMLVLLFLLTFSDGNFFSAVTSERVPSSFDLHLMCSSVKGTVSRDFRLLVFFHESVSPKPLSIPLGPHRIFLKIGGDIQSSRCTTGIVDTGGKSKKSSIIKVSIILFGHLWEVELTYRYIFAVKFTLRSQQPDIVPIICHRCQ